MFRYYIKQRIYVYVKKTLMEEFSINLTAENIYFSDHDAVRIVIDKNAVDFHTIS